jgi:C1A family cysteine protease
VAKDQPKNDPTDDPRNKSTKGPKNAPIDLGELREALQSEGAPWQMAYTSITALNEDEREIRLGVPPSPGISTDALEQDREAAAATAAEARAEAVGAPTSFDLRNVGGVNYSTPIKNQGSCGSCAAFGVVGAMEGVARFTRRAGALPFDLSEAHMYFCHGHAAGARCNTGWWPEQALNAARNTGVTFEEYYPYTAVDQACTGLNADWPNRLAKVTNYAFMNGNPSTMKEWISTYGAMDACMDVYQDFFSYSSGIYKHITGNYAGGHCVTLIGYDDVAKCWIAKNSWGTGWGEAGHFRIAYGDCRIETYLQPGGSGAIGIQGVSVRAWLPNQVILGLWNNEFENNAWAYGSIRGWLKLGNASPTTSEAMLLELAAAKAGNRQVGLYENNGTVEQIYAW